MAQREFVYLDSDNIVEVANLREVASQKLLNTTDFPGLVVTYRMLDSTGTPVVGVTDPVSMTEITTDPETGEARKGLFRGGLPDTATLAAGETGTFVITADAGAGLKRDITFEWEVLSVIEV